MKVSNSWQNFNFWETIPLKSCFHCGICMFASRPNTRSSQRYSESAGLWKISWVYSGLFLCRTYKITSSVRRAQSQPSCSQEAVGTKEEHDSQASTSTLVLTLTEVLLWQAQYLYWNSTIFFVTGWWTKGGFRTKVQRDKPVPIDHTCVCPSLCDKHFRPPSFHTTSNVVVDNNIIPIYIGYAKMNCYHCSKFLSSLGQEVTDS